MESWNGFYYLYSRNKQLRKVQSKYMEIPKELLDKWQTLAAYGDAGKIAESMPEAERVTPQAIRDAMSKGTCSETVFKAIGDFYKKRAEIIEQYL